MSAWIVDVCCTQRDDKHLTNMISEQTECILIEMMRDCRSLSSGFSRTSLVSVKQHSLTTSHTHTKSQYHHPYACQGVKKYRTAHCAEINAWVLTE